jgi:hypothetical protein
VLGRGGDRRVELATSLVVRNSTAPRLEATATAGAGRVS